MNYKVYRLNKYSGVGKLRAFVDVLVNDEIIIKGFKVIDGEQGLFVGNPSEKGKDNKYFDTVFFQIPNQKNALEKVVLDEYEKQMETK